MKKLFLTILCLSLYPIYTQPKDQFLEWKPIPKIKNYRVQIKNSKNKTIIDKIIPSTKYPLVQLPLGNYQSRVAPLNVLKKPIVWSNWRPLKIVRVYTPDIDNRSDPIILTESAKQTVTVKGKNFVEDTKVNIQSGKQKIPIDHIVSNQNKLSFRVDTHKAKPGVYDLSIENPRNKKVFKKDFIRIAAKDEVISITPKKEEKIVLDESNSVTFRWSKNPHASKYKFKIKSSKSKSLLDDETSKNSYTIPEPSKLEEGRLTWEVQPIQKDGKKGKISSNSFELIIKGKPISITIDDIQLTSPDVFYIDEDKEKY